MVTMTYAELFIALAISAGYGAIMLAVTRYALRRSREIKHAQANGWRFVSLGSFITGPIYAPPTTPEDADDAI